MHTITALLLVLLFARFAAAQTVLYDGAFGTLPGNQGWTYFATGGTQTAPVLPTAPYTILDTTGANSFQGGYTRISPIALDRTIGYTYRFDIKIEQEAHSRIDRAGFSAIIIGSDKRGIELGFWNDRLFAQNDGITADDGQTGTSLFTHGEEALLNTTNGITRYDLQVQNNGYNLFTNGTSVLSGNLRDYTAFSGPINPYVVANNLFLGDDTTSASVKWNFGYASVQASPTPEISSWYLMCCGGLLFVFGIPSRRKI